VSLVKSIRKRWAVHMARMWVRSGYRVFVGQREGKRSLGRPRRMWEDIIKMDLQEERPRGGGMEWTDVTQNRDRCEGR